MFVGEGANRVIGVGLRANAEALARELNTRYGAAVELTVGLFPFPPPTAPQRACDQVRRPVVDHQPLEAAVAIGPTVVAGDFIRGKVRLMNAGVGPYELNSSSTFPVYLFRPGDQTPVGSPEGASAGTGFGKTLAPGETVLLDAGGGTASCDLALGYVVPAGTYEARALIDFQEPVTFDLRFFWSAPTMVEVVRP